MFHRVLSIACCVTILLTAPAAAQTVTRTENFDRDPGWDAQNNRLIPKQIPTVSQDFGYSRTNFAGGAIGEIGGRIWRSTKPAYYATPIETRTLDDRMRMRGKMSLQKTDGASGCYFGWFAAHQPGSGRPISSLGIYLDAEGTGARMYAGVLTKTNRAHLLWETDFEIGKKNPPIKPNGKPRTWELIYDPEGADGLGEMTLIFDGKPPVKTALPEGFRQEGAIFERFGLMNFHKGGNPLTLYLDDITVNGREWSFDDDPQWESVGSRETYQDDVVTGHHNFGYSKTNHAGGKPGELGGLFWRVENPLGYYADDIGKLTLDTPLEASGKVAFTTGAMDAGMFIGWFNSKSKHLPDTDFRNVCGIYIEGPTRIGHYFRPICATADGRKGDPQQGPVILPNGKSRQWSLRYDPAAGGALIVTLDEETFRYPLPKDFQKTGAEFDRFGVFTARTGGSHVRLYFDDLKYTAEK